MKQGTGVRVTHSQETIDKARALYIAGELTFLEMSERLGVPQRTITTWRQKFRWADLPRKKIPVQRVDYKPRANITPAQRANINAQKQMFQVLRRPAAPPSAAEAERAVAEWLARGNRPTICEPGCAVSPDHTIQPTMRGGPRMGVL